MRLRASHPLTLFALGVAFFTGRLPAQTVAPSAPSVVVFDHDNAPRAPQLDDLALRQSVSQRGITWTFAKPARVGQFIGGDWYVVGPITIQNIEPRPLFGDEVQTAPVKTRDVDESRYPGQFARNGSTLNLPAVVPPNKITPRTRRSGFDSRMPMNTYDPNQFKRLPIEMTPGDSLVSSISNEPLGDGGYPIKAVAVLTCVASPQPADAFRPSFCQTATCLTYLARNLRRDLLLRLPKPSSASKIKPTDYADCFQAPWIDTVGYGRAMPRIRFSFYGAAIAEVIGSSSLLLLLDYTPQEKEPLLLGMVQTGIDLHGFIRGGGGWPAEGGGAAGRKWPIVFAGLLLDEPSMVAVKQHYPDGRFHEDEQTAFCPLEFAGQKYERGWTGAKAVWTGHYAYYRGQWRRNKWEGTYDPVDLIPPKQWLVPWSEGSEGYRRNSTSAAWVAQALAARLMHAEDVWGHDAFFAYVDRWMTEDDAPFYEAIRQNIEDRVPQNDAEKQAIELARTQFARTKRSGTISGRAELVPVVQELWTKHRNHLPPRSDGKQVPPAEQTWK